MGKTTVLEETSKSHDIPLPAGHRKLPSFQMAFREDLRQFKDALQSEMDLDGAIHTHDRVYLYLDSFDEVWPRIQHLPQSLPDLLMDYPETRLFLRITCRTAVLPRTLVEGLKSQWGEENVQKYALAPLSQRNVRIALQQEGIDEDEFYAQLTESGAHQFACNPLTLTMLLGHFKESHRLPSSRVELFEKACFNLCSESLKRIDASQPRETTPEKRFGAAKVMAAFSILCNRESIYHGLERNSVSMDSVTRSHVESRVNFLRDSNDTFHTFNDMLNVGLFSGSEEYVSHWRHKSYSEFLCASFVCSLDLSTEQIESLFFIPFEGKLWSIPELQQTVAWLSAMNEKASDLLLEHDPDVQLLSDPSQLDEDRRQRLVLVLLEKYEQGLLHDQISNYLLAYHRLNYPGISDDLRPYILNRKSRILSRRFALNVAERCNCRDLAEDIFTIAESEEEDPNIRREAVDSLKVLLPGDDKGRLIPILDNLQHDPGDRIRGSLIEGLFPTHIGFPKILDYTTPRQDHSFLGDYYFFASNEVGKRIPVDDLPQAIQWVIDSWEDHDFDSVHRKMRESILKRAWLDLESSESREVLSEFFLREPYSCLKLKEEMENDLRIVGEEEGTNREGVREFAAMIVTRAGKDGSDVHNDLIWHDPPLVKSEDVPWIIDQIDETKKEEVQKRWVELLIQILRETEGMYRETIESVWEFFQPLENGPEEIRRLFEPMQLNDPIALQWKGVKRSNHASDSRLIANPTSEQSVEEILSFSRTGSPKESWIDVCDAIEECARMKCQEGKLPLLKSIQNQFMAHRDEIREIALAFVENVEPPEDSIITRNQYFLWEVHVPKAFEILFALFQVPDQLLTHSAWEKWIPTLVALGEIAPWESDQTHTEVLRCAYLNHGNLFIKSLRNRVLFLNSLTRKSFLFRDLGLDIDKRLGELAIELVDDQSLSPLVSQDIWEFLLKSNFTLGISKAFTILEDKQQALESRILIGSILFIHRVLNDCA
ncbi:MAG: hypothetical protein H6752_19040 [Candidatus Omnitrophica bacterium]|nr:hypothetical protein [Candidatus Omnitrophota bacterium]